MLNHNKPTNFDIQVYLYPWYESCETREEMKSMHDKIVKNSKQAMIDTYNEFFGDMYGNYEEDEDNG